jgi:hypothetical protein
VTAATLTPDARMARCALASKYRNRALLTVSAASLFTLAFVGLLTLWVTLAAIGEFAGGAMWFLWALMIAVLAPIAAVFAGRSLPRTIANARLLRARAKLFETADDPAAVVTSVTYSAGGGDGADFIDVVHQDGGVENFLAILNRDLFDLFERVGVAVPRR